MEQQEEKDEPAITWDTSRDVTDMIVNQARVLAILPLKRLAQFLEHAHGIGPLIDPTGWIHHHRGIEVAKELVGASIQFVARIEAALKMKRDG